MVDVSLLRADLISMHTSFSGLVAQDYPARAVNTLCGSDHVRMFNGQLFVKNLTALKAEADDDDDDLQDEFNKSMNNKNTPGGGLEGVVTWNSESLAIVDSTILSVEKEDRLLSLPKIFRCLN